jgi:hypothetical protein
VLPVLICGQLFLVSAKTLDTFTFERGYVHISHTLFVLPRPRSRQCEFDHLLHMNGAGSFHEDPDRAVATPSPHRTYIYQSLLDLCAQQQGHKLTPADRQAHAITLAGTKAAFALRNELSWIAGTLPLDLIQPQWTIVHRFVRPLPSRYLLPLCYTCKRVCAYVCMYAK